MASDSEAPSTPRRYLAVLSLMLCGVAALMIFPAVLFASMHQTPGTAGVLKGVALGLFAGLLVCGCGAWLAMALVAVVAPFDGKTADELVVALRPVLAELEATRARVVRQVNTRAMTWVPLGALAGGALWFLEHLSGRADPDGVSGVVLNAVALIGAGAFAGYFYAAQARSRNYAELYFQRVLPVLAARFGNLSYRSPAQIDLSALAAEGLFEKFNSSSADIEFFGTHRGTQICIAAIVLELGSGEDRRIQFDGLLVAITLPRVLRGTTAVIAKRGAFEYCREWLKDLSRRPVSLEDPAFAASYDVWSTDQITARALLTPAFMERLLALGVPAATGRAVLLARDNRLTLAIPGARGIHFTAPNFRKPAASRDSLLALYNNIAAALAVADSVIEVDQGARTAAAQGEP